MYSIACSQYYCKFIIMRRIRYCINVVLTDHRVYTYAAQTRLKCYPECIAVWVSCV